MHVSPSNVGAATALNFHNGEHFVQYEITHDYSHYSDNIYFNITVNS